MQPTPPVPSGSWLAGQTHKDRVLGFGCHEDKYVQRRCTKVPLVACAQRTTNAIGFCRPTGSQWHCPVTGYHMSPRANHLGMSRRPVRAPDQGRPQGMSQGQVWATHLGGPRGRPHDLHAAHPADAQWQRATAPHAFTGKGGWVSKRRRGPTLSQNGRGGTPSLLITTHHACR